MKIRVKREPLVVPAFTKLLYGQNHQCLEPPPPPPAAAGLAPITTAFGKRDIASANSTLLYQFHRHLCILQILLVRYQGPLIYLLYQ